MLLIVLTSAAALSAFDLSHENHLNRQLVSRIRVESSVISDRTWAMSVADQESQRVVSNDAAADIMAAQALANGLPAEKANELANKIKARGATLAKLTQARHLHQNVPLQRICYFDLENAQTRTEDTDSRDLAAISAAHNLSATETLTYDLSGVQVRRKSGSVRLVKNAGKLALHEKGGLTGFHLDYTELRAGLLPSSLLEMPFLTVAPAPDGTDFIEVTGKESANGPVRMRATASISAGYRPVSCVAYDELGATSWTLAPSDYREVGPAKLPFKTVLVLSLFELDWTETSTVSSVSLDAPMDDTLFQTPTDYSVQQMD